MKRFILFVMIGYCTSIFCMDGQDEYPLHTAAWKRNHKEMIKLLAQGADPNGITRNNGNTPLHLAVTEKGVKILLDAGADVNARDNNDKTPLSLMLSARSCDNKNNRPIADMLLQYGADIHIVDWQQRSLLHKAVEQDVYWAADWLLSHGIDRTMRDLYGLTAFELEIQKIKANKQQMLTVFEKHGMIFFPGLRPIELLSVSQSICSGDFDSYSGKPIELLNNIARLFACERVYSRDKITTGIMFNQYGCIVHAVSAKDLEHYFGSEEKAGINELLLLLVRHVNDGIQKQDFSKVAYVLKKLPWVTHFDPRETLSIMEMATKEPDTRYLKLLLKSGIRCFDHSHSYIGTCWHTAVMADNPAAIRVLMDYCTDILEKNIDELTPMQMAINLNKTECIAALNEELCDYSSVEFLMKNYKKSKQLLSEVIDCNVILGDTGFILLNRIVGAPTGKVMKFIPLLIAKGADVNKVDANGKSPLWSLMSIGNVHKKLPVFKMLLQAGARVNKKCGVSGKSLLEVAFGRGHILLAELFFEHGAIVMQEMMEQENEEISQDLQDRLRERYASQECCVCYESPADLEDLPSVCVKQCMRFICKTCYDNLKLQSCPFCFKRLGLWG